MIPGEGGDVLKDKLKEKLKGKGINIGEVQGEDIPFESKVIRTGSYTMGKVFPTIGMYRTVEDLRAIDTIDFGEKYNEEFFKTKALIVIEVQEGSGSVRHEVSKVVKNGDIITVGIKRIAPEFGTADMAEWAIFVEIDKSVVDDNTVANLVFT